MTVTPMCIAIAVPPSPVLLMRSDPGLPVVPPPGDGASAATAPCLHGDIWLSMSVGFPRDSECSLVDSCINKEDLASFMAFPWPATAATSLQTLAPQPARLLQPLAFSLVLTPSVLTPSLQPAVDASLDRAPVGRSAPGQGQGRGRAGCNRACGGGGAGYLVRVHCFGEGPGKPSLLCTAAVTEPGIQCLDQASSV